MIETVVHVGVLYSLCSHGLAHGLSSGLPVLHPKYTRALHVVEHDRMVVSPLTNGTTCSHDATCSLASGNHTPTCSSSPATAGSLNIGM